MGSHVEPDEDLSEGNGVSGGFPVTQLCLFLLLVVSSEKPGCQLSYRYKYTDAMLHRAVSFSREAGQIAGEEEED